MLVEVKVPMLSESVAEATLVSWHKKQGEQVERDENLVDVETDKVVMELPASHAGILKEIIKGDGATVVSGEVIAKIDTEAAASESETKSVKNTPLAEEGGEAETEASEPRADPSIPMLMPAARKLAEENHLKTSETNAIKGTGRGGRITREDVQAYIQHKAKGKSETPDEEESAAVEPAEQPVKTPEETTGAVDRVSAQTVVLPCRDYVCGLPSGWCNRNRPLRY